MLVLTKQIAFYGLYLIHHLFSFYLAVSRALLAAPRSFGCSAGLPAINFAFLNEILSLSHAEMQVCCYAVQCS